MSEIVNGVLSLHVAEHRIRAALDGHVEEGVDSGVRQDGRHLLHVFHDVGRVGHPETQHAAVGDHLHQLPKQVGKSDSNVAAVGTEVLAGEPDFNHSLCGDLINKSFTLSLLVKFLQKLISLAHEELSLCLLGNFQHHSSSGF